ncbi:MAG: PKD domain-containing protein, partial [Bacteroidales bacterium]
MSGFFSGATATGATASHVYSVTGVYTATVTATNAQGSQQATTIVTVTNEQPIADAGPEQTVEINQLVMLDGSDSYDPDEHTPLAYGWMQTGGPLVSLSSYTAVSPNFTAPSQRSVLTFTLMVTDSF